MLPILLVLLCFVRLGSLGVPSFNPQTSYQYEYTLDMQIANVARLSIPQTRLEVHANMETYILWRNQTQPDEQLVYLQFNNFTTINKKKVIPNRKEDTNAQHPNEAVKSKGLMLPFLFHWHAGKVIGLYSTGENNNYVLDLKRGLVSLFQFQPKPGTYSEEDALGKCQVTYNVSEDFIYKTKDLSSCEGSSFGYEADHEGPKNMKHEMAEFTLCAPPGLSKVHFLNELLAKDVFGVSWNSSSNGYLLLNGTTFQKAVSQESYNLSANLGSLFGTHITSRQQLELMSSKPGPLEIVGESIEVVLGKLPEKYRKVPFESHPPIHPAPSDESSLLKKYLAISKRKKLTVPKISTVKHFQALVKTFKHAKQRDIQQLFQAASPDLLPFFIDAAVAAQTHASIFALSDFLDFTKKKQAKIHEKFLYSAAFAPHPSIELLNLVLEKLRAKVPNPEVMETGIIIAGAIIGKICRMDLCEEEDVELAKDTILEGLNNAEDEDEMKIYLLSLKNAQLPETIPTLLQYAEEHTGVVCSTALSALQAFPPYFLSDQEVKDTMKSILHQTNQLHDKNSRLMAAETLLLADCTSEDLTDILAGLQLMDTESSKLLISKLHNRLNLQHPLKNTSNKYSKSIFHHNYWYLSQAGKSVVFSRLLTATDDLASTYGVDLLFADSGLLKRSTFHNTLFDLNHHLKIIQFTVEAQGLEFLIGNEEKEDEGEDASVGLSAVFFDVQLRPVIYFKGYMDLISKVLSESGEPLSAMKGNVLLVDYLQWLPMQSGLQAMVQYQGGLGFDISSNIAVSIWDQQTKTNVNAKAGLVFELKTEVDTSFFHVDMTAKVEAEGTIDQDTITKVSNAPVSMCIELRHDDIPYRETYIITETYPEAHTTHTVRKGRKSTLRGRDFPFHYANSEMCGLLKAEEDVITKLTA